MVKSNVWIDQYCSAFFLHYIYIKFLAVTCSASQVESVTIGCFFELHVKAVSPMYKTNLVVLFLSTKSLAQSLSLLPTRFKLLLDE